MAVAVAMAVAPLSEQQHVTAAAAFRHRTLYLRPDYKDTLTVAHHPSGRGGVTGAITSL
jgi:hypothetical protein